MQSQQCSDRVSAWTGQAVSSKAQESSVGTVPGSKPGSTALSSARCSLVGLQKKKKKKKEPTSKQRPPK